MNCVAGRSRKIVCVHLYDDFSGSAKVFAQGIAALESAGHEVRVLVGSHGEAGFIRRAHAVETFPYHFPTQRWRLLLCFVAAQWRLFWCVRSTSRQWGADLIYVNTVLPVGAVAAAVFSDIQVLAHVHEVGSGTPGLFRALLWCVSRGADKIICVSRYVAETLPLPRSRVRMLPNSLDADSERRAEEIWSQRTQRTGCRPFSVTMACSLKWYKGMDSFLYLARDFERDASPIRFVLVLNCDAVDLESFLAGQSIPANVSVIRRPASVFDVYRESDLVVNLSHRDGWIETFGLTLLEAMACGIPVIAPRTGGCTELFRDGEGGWRIDSRDFDHLKERIKGLASDREAWELSCRTARMSAARFSRAGFDNGLKVIVDEMRAGSRASRTVG